MKEIAECLTCGVVFEPAPRHPMVTSAWCASCLRTMQERHEIIGYLAGGKAIRSDDV